MDTYFIGSNYFHWSISWIKICHNQKC